MIEPIMDAIKNSEEPEWLERPVFGGLRLWQLVFLCFAAVTALIVMLCCCFRFRIPRTKQQIEADYHRRRITNKFRRELENIQDSKMDNISLQDALELLFEKKTTVADTKPALQPSSIDSQQPSSSEPVQPLAPSPLTDDPQASGMGFVKFARKVSILNKIAPKSPTPSGSKIDF